MTVLQLIPRSAFPPRDGGQISIANVTYHLRKNGAEVIVLCLDESAPFVQTIQYKGFDFRLYSLRHSTKNSIARGIASLFSQNPVYLSKHYSPVLVDQAMEILRIHNVDVLHADHTAMAPLGLELSRRSALPLGLRLHNIESRIWSRYAESLPFWHPLQWYTASQARKLRKAEANAIAESDSAFPISEVDCDQAKRMAPGARLITVRAGVNPEEWAELAESKRASNELLLVGQWAWRHNVDGALWFAREVLPGLRRRVPSVKLIIPGKNAPKELQGREAENIFCLGFVENIAEIYHRASVFVVPLFVGSGVRIKIVEAMAAAMPVVGTVLASEGIFAKEEDGLYKIDGAEDQIKCIESLLKDEALARHRGAAAQAFVRSQHDWGREIGKIYEEYERLSAANKK